MSEPKNGNTVLTRSKKGPDRGTLARAAEALLAALDRAGISGPDAVRKAKRDLQDALDYPPPAA
jgi:hypothetical protein